MGILWQTALSNAALVAAGAPIVWLIGRYARRPALTHSLAVILLLKLITPPLWRVPVSWPQETPVKLQVALEKQSQPRASPDAVMVTQASAPPPETQQPARNLIIESGPAPVGEPAAKSVIPAVATVRPFDWRQWLWRAIPIAGWIWAAGSALCAIIALIRVVRFTRALRFATPAQEVQPRARMLARRLRLRHSPSVWFVPAFVSPMLWSVGTRPRLLLPKGLWDRLDIAGRDTILLHELAHWRRGDHWVRWIELLATCLYWWHPACWWARRELREAEEQCCDAWVLWAIPGTFKNYANALLEAVEFASIPADRPSVRAAVPVLASRMGQFVHLRRRLTMLKHGNISRALSWGGLAGVMTLGSIVLPLAPTWGQEQTVPSEGQVGVVEATPPPAPTPAPPAAASSQPAPAPERAAGPLTRTQPDRFGQADTVPGSMQLQQQMELAQARQRIAQLERELNVACDRLKVLEGGQYGVAPAPQPKMPVAPTAPPPPAALPSENTPYSGRPETLAPGEVLSDHRISIREVPPTTPGAPADGELRAIITDPTTGQTREIRARAMDFSGSAAAQNQSERLDKIEAQLRMLMDEIAMMRATNNSRPGPAPAGTPQQR